MTWFPGWVRVAVALAVLVWIPGWVITRFLLDTRSLPAILQVPLALVTGLSAQSLLAGGCLATGSTLGACAGAAQFAAAAVLALGWWRQRPGRAPGVSWAMVFAVIVLVVLGLSVRSAPGVEEDAFDHIGYVRHMIVVDRVVPGDVLAAPVDDPIAPPTDPRKGTFHVLLAAISEIAALDPYDTWQYTTLFVFPFSFLAFLAFCRGFVHSRAQLGWCAALFLFSYGGIGLHFSRTVLYGQHLATLWYWILAAVCLVPARCSTRRSLLCVAIISLGGVLSHAGVALHALVLAASLVLFAPAFGYGRRRAIRVGLVIAIAMSPALTARLLGGGDINVLHAHEQGLLFLSPRWFVFSPVEAVRQYGLLFVGGLVALPVMLAFVRRDAAVRRQWAMSVLPLLVCFVPVFAAVLFEKTSYMVFRSLLNVPAFPVVVVMCASLVAWARRGGVLRRGAVAAGLVAWALVFVAPSVRAVAHGLSEGRGPSFREDNAGLIEYLRTLPSGTVIASDPKTSYALSAFVPHHFVAVHGQHGNPYDDHAMERLEAVRDILLPWAPATEVVRHCDRFAVDIVVVNGRMPTHSRELLALWDQKFYDDAVDRLESLGQRFRRIYHEGDVTVLLHDPVGSATGAWSGQGAPAILSDPRIADRLPCAVKSPESDYEVTHIGIDPPVVIPGEEVRIEIQYAKSQRSAFGFSHMMHVRFDHESISDTPRYPGEKYVRRSEERRVGRIRRFRHDRVAFDGALPRDYWPLGREFHDSFVVRVPVWVEKGNYRVQVTIERRTILPNFTLDDLLYNRDHYTGTNCGSLVVSDRMVK